jgi:hypothetical protein
VRQGTASRRERPDDHGLEDDLDVPEFMPPD